MERRDQAAPYSFGLMGPGRVDLAPHWPAISCKSIKAIYCVPRVFSGLLEQIQEQWRNHFRRLNRTVVAHIL
jgi:hypothetical protein